MKKEELKEHLIEIQEGIISDLKAEIDSYHQGKDLDEEDTMDPEDFSHQAEAGHIEHNLKEQLRKAEEELDLLNNLPAESRSEIGPGTLITLDDRLLFVGLATLPFEHEGLPVLSISTHAPIYPLIQKKQVGDSIQLGKKKHKIISID